MRPDDSIQTLRKSVQDLEEEVVAMESSDINADLAKALGLVAMELHDTDRALYEAVFLNNDSEIQKLIDEIDQATQGGKQVLHQLGQLKKAVDNARAKVQAATGNVTKLNELLDKADEIVDVIKGNI